MGESKRVEELKDIISRLIGNGQSGSLDVGYCRYCEQYRSWGRFTQRTEKHRKDCVLIEAASVIGIKHSVISECDEYISIEAGPERIHMGRRARDYLE